MSDFTGVIVVIVAVACMLLSQRKNLSSGVRRQYSLMGIATSALVAVEAMHRGAGGVAGLFAVAAACSLIGVLFDLLKPSNPNS